MLRLNAKSVEIRPIEGLSKHYLHYISYTPNVPTYRYTHPNITTVAGKKIVGILFRKQRNQHYFIGKRFNKSWFNKSNIYIYYCLL